MSQYIRHDNCVYCGGPIRNELLKTHSEKYVFQIPYCSEECLSKDSESKKVIEDCIHENTKYKQEAEEAEQEKLRNLQNPAYLVELENQKKTEKESTKAFVRNSIYYVVIGIGGIVILSSLASGNTDSILNKYTLRVLLVGGVALLIAKIRG